MVYVNIRRHLLRYVGVFIMPVRLGRLASLEIGHCVEVFKKSVEAVSLSMLLSGTRMRLGGLYEERREKPSNTSR